MRRGLSIASLSSVSLALTSIALVAMGCGGGPVAPPITTDAGCGSMGVPADQPVIGCPESVDLGCLPAGGAPASYLVSSAACDGTTPAITCTPASGTTITAATTATCTATSASGATASCTFAIRARVPGAASLSCAPAVVAACMGSRTSLTLTPPIVNEPCEGGTVSAVTDDAPAAGFAVGGSSVTFSATGPDGAMLSCATPITVVDDTSPSITCSSAPMTIVRTAPSDVIANATPRATDDCDDEVVVTLDPMPTGHGRTVTTARAVDDAGNTASCMLTIDVIDVFAPTGLRILSATLAGDGTTDLTLGWAASGGADVENIVVERGPSSTGPFAEIARLPATATTYTDDAMPAPRAFYRLAALGPSSLRGGQTRVLRALAIQDDGYELASSTVPTVPFPTTLYGVVRAPSELTADGPFPLVVFLHGNHGNCRPATGDDECADTTEHACTEPGFTTTPNAEGYVYLMETLAASGYVAVSLSANALNCRDDFIPERTQLILEHLRRWQRWSTTDEAPFTGRYRGAVDLARVAVVGHSRGGEAVSQVPAALRATPITGVSLASVFAIAPTDYHDNTPQGVPYAVLLPSCDADVTTLEGLRMYDRGLAARDGEARAQVLVVGANHNFFNTEWRFDDNDFGAVCTSGLVGAPAQRGMLEIALADWLGATVLDGETPAYVRNEEGSPPLMDFWAGSDLDLRWSYASPDRAIIDRFTSLTTTETGQPSTFAGFTAATDCAGTCAGAFPHLVNGARLAWQDVMATAGFGLGGMDVGTHTAISLRFASRIARINDGLPDHDFTIRVSDASGHTADVLVSAVGRVPTAFTSRAAAEVLSTVRLRVERLTAISPGFDVHHLSSFELMMPVAGHAQGSIWVTDIELAGE